MNRADVDNLVYLIVCAINHQCPRVEEIDLESLYRLAEKHSLASIIGFALDFAGINNPDFRQAKARAIRRAVILNIERNAVLERLEQAGIWYMPLKGAVLQTYYPQIGMREMSDNDILFDANRAKDVREIMEQRGFETIIYDSGHRDDYHKQPISNFEMHRVLFCSPADKRILRYYENVKSRLVKDEGNRYGFHFSNEDFYLYMVAHEQKHYKWGGTGIRSLLDTYVFWERFGESLELEYLRTELKKLGLSEFERDNRELALALFHREPLTEKQEQILNYFLESGTYGTKEHVIKNSLWESSSYLEYIIHRAFLSMDVIKEHYPIFFKHKILLLFLPFYRVCVNRRNVKKELKILLSMRRVPKE